MINSWVNTADTSINGVGTSNISDLKSNGLVLNVMLKHNLRHIRRLKCLQYHSGLATQSYYD